MLPPEGAGNLPADTLRTGWYSVARKEPRRWAEVGTDKAVGNMGDSDDITELRRAVKRAERSARTRDEWLLRARHGGASFDALAAATGWDRRTVARYLLKLAEQYMITVEGDHITIEEVAHNADV